MLQMFSQEILVSQVLFAEKRFRRLECIKVSSTRFFFTDNELGFEIASQ